MMESNNKTCFVLLGERTADFKTGRFYEPDELFTSEIKPVLDLFYLKIYNFGSLLSGLDTDNLLRSILIKADIIIACLESLNPNNMFILGVRESVKPGSTILIAPDKTPIPSGLRLLAVRTDIRQLHPDINYSEIKRFRSEILLKMVTILNGIIIGSEKKEFNAKELARLHSAENIAFLIRQGNLSFHEKNFEDALLNFSKAAEMTGWHNKYVIRNVAEAAFKCGQPDKDQALVNALLILNRLPHREDKDCETLFLLGTIHKKIFEQNLCKKNLNTAISNFEKVYYSRGDYLSGINLAYLYLIKGILLNCPEKTDRHNKKGTSMNLNSEESKKTSNSDIILARKTAQRIISEINKLRSRENLGKRKDIKLLYRVLSAASYIAGKSSAGKYYWKKSLDLKEEQFENYYDTEQHAKLLDLLNTGLQTSLGS